MIVHKQQVAALNPDIGIESASVDNLFLGNHITYDVGDCRLVRRTNKPMFA
jgi:hypothetical protein